MIAVVDYGMGNIRSVCKAFEYIGQQVVVTNEPDALNTVDAIVLPGVGAFGDAMRHLRELNLIDKLNEQVLEKKKPFLGICLGMQLVAKKSHEHGINDGLGWIDCEVQRLTGPTDLRIPHVGWNDVTVTDCSGGLFDGVKQNSTFYFVHSFAVKHVNGHASAHCQYGDGFVAAVKKDNIFAVQFHPEKSQKSGQQLLRNIVNWIENSRAD